MYTINLTIEYEEVDYSANNQYGIGYNCFSTNHHFTAETETLADKKSASAFSIYKAKPLGGVSELKQSFNGWSLSKSLTKC